MGGLAAERMTANGVPYDRGAAYWTAPYKEELEILKKIELGNFEERYPIPEPIDTYLNNGKLYGEEKGLWDPVTLEQLPVSFEIFKYELHACIKGNPETCHFRIGNWNCFSTIFY